MTVSPSVTLRIDSIHAFRLPPRSATPFNPFRRADNVSQNNISFSIKSEKSVNRAENPESCIAPPAILIAVTLCDWQGSTIAYDFQQLGYQSARLQCGLQFNCISAKALLCCTPPRVRRAIFLQFSMLQHSKLLQNNKWDFKKTCFSVSQSAIQRNNTYCTLHNCNLYRH